MRPHEGLICVRSATGQHETTERLVADLAMRGLPIVARIDHADAAYRVGLDMLPAELFIFGNPHAGTPLMRAAPSIAIDLPLKILVTEGASGICWLTYNDPVWIGRRHDVDMTEIRMLRVMRELLAVIVAAAAGRNGSER
jgi:uncharacterized protein (DUF302 family)